jgi:predicted Rossmann fold nucleotide-binding protein DprA/Smf involved in DNA uptake
MVQSQLASEIVRPDTQAVLLLCGSFARPSSAEAKPLTLQEYNALATWLVRQRKRPADLLRGAEDLLTAGVPELPEAERIRSLLARGVQMATAVDHWQRLGLWVISRGEDRYPERWRRSLRLAAPALLYGVGDVARLTRGGLAIIGSRDIDEEGLSFTRRVAGRCADNGLQVISGGARGVDQAAVSAALEAGGGAVAVLADHLDRAATSREAKEWIRNRMLTLVSPYGPESGFTVGKAMGRNKHIYATADFALAVRFAAGSGGTWAGAVEQLRQNTSGGVSVPVFARVSYNPKEGWTELQRRGALPFPEEAFWTGKVEETLRRAASQPTAPQQTIPPLGSLTVQSESTADAKSLAEGNVPSETSTPLPLEFAPAASNTASSLPTITGSEVDTCYSRCLPLLIGHLQKEPGEKELPKIANQLDVLLKQLKDWLKRAIGEGRIKRKKSGRRIVYSDASSNGESGLFGQGGDAA